MLQAKDVMQQELMTALYKEELFPTLLEEARGSARGSWEKRCAQDRQRCVTRGRASGHIRTFRMIIFP